jgi:phage shock protein PspC (stress-responsive transcriptional regulator)
MADRLYRSEDDRIIGGVCGGIAEVYELDPSLVRLGLVLFTLAGGSGILAYIIAWIVIPTESEVEKEEKVKDIEAEKVEESQTEEEKEDEE